MQRRSNNYLNCGRNEPKSIRSGAKITPATHLHASASPWCKIKVNNTQVRRHEPKRITNARGGGIQCAEAPHKTAHNQSFKCFQTARSQIHRQIDIAKANNCTNLHSLCLHSGPTSHPLKFDPRPKRSVARVTFVGFEHATQWSLHATCNLSPNGL